jgi:hypothetical protein
VNIKQMRAARALARGTTQAEAAREAGVDRATVARWLKLPEFAQLVVTATSAGDSEGDPTEEAEKGLSRLVPQAEQVLEEALSGGNVTPSMAKVALDIIKAARALEPAAREEGTPTLHSLILEMDEAEAAAGNTRGAKGDARKVS